MSSDLTLDVEDHQQLNNNPMMMMDSDTGTISIDQGGEWDISLFDELDLGYTDDLLQALEHAGYVAGGPDLDFDMDLPPWNTDTSSTCTDGEVSVDSLSSVPSPASVEALSPCSLSDEALSPGSQPSPASICSESSGFYEAPPPVKRAPKRASQAARAKPTQPVKRPIQPRPVITAVPLAHAAAPLQAKTIILQPLQTTVLPVVKPAPISIQPAPPPGRPLVLSQAAQVLQIQAPQSLTGHVVTMPTLCHDRHTSVTGHVVAMPTPSQDRRTSVVTPPMVSIVLRAPSSDEDSKVSQRQQRMIKNRESASLSRKKKKEYLLTLETRLKLTLSENTALKNENGSLKRQLEGLLCENTDLKTTSPKRRAVCLMAVLVFLVLNVGPSSVFQGGGPGSGLQAGSTQQQQEQHGGRHLLGFSPETGAGPGPLRGSSDPPQAQADSSEDKALMVVKDAIFLRAPSPCLPPVNRTKCIELAHELRVWVHRHEVEATKSRRLSNSHHKATRTILKPADKEADVARIVTVQYTDPTEEENLGNELQVYYAPHRTYSDFFDEINRRGDTFYVVSFRRDHLLLPATSHLKGSRPKMSVVLPAMNINDSIINKDKDFEVMMQIDCEVTDTRILHVKSSSIPPLLRVNHTDTLYPRSTADGQATPPVGVLMGSA